jgi:hypothetical protein
MHTSGKFKTLRLLLRTAKALRTVAAESLEADEADLFLRGAITLEKRAETLANCRQAIPPEIHTHIDLVC